MSRVRGLGILLLALSLPLPALAQMTVSTVGPKDLIPIIPGGSGTVPNRFVTPPVLMGTGSITPTGGSVPISLSDLAGELLIGSPSPVNLIGTATIGGNGIASQPASPIANGNVVLGSGAGALADSGKAAPGSPFVGTSDSQILTNKTISSPIVTGTVGGGASYTAPTITGPTITGTVAGNPDLSGGNVTPTGGGGSHTLADLAGGLLNANPALSLNLAPTANSLLQGIDISQSGAGTPASASPCGNASGFTFSFSFNCFMATSDAINATNTNNKETAVLAIFGTVNGGAGTGNKNALISVEDLIALPTAGLSGVFITGGQIAAEADVASDGTVGTPLGSVIGLGVYGLLGSGATNYQDVSGLEADVKVVGTATVKFKTGIAAAQIAGDVTNGTAETVGVVVDAHAGAPGWVNAFQVGGWNEATNSPIVAGGNVLVVWNGAVGGTALGTGIDLTGTSTINGIVGTGFTYTTFLNLSASNFWSGDGHISSLASAHPNDFVRSDAGSVMNIENSGANAALFQINPRTAGQEAQIALQDAGTVKFIIAKDASNELYIKDNTQSLNALLLSATGNLTLGETGKTLNLIGTTIEENGVSGKSQTCTVNQALTLIFTNGILTGGTCNS